MYAEYMTCLLKLTQQITEEPPKLYAIHLEIGFSVMMCLESPDYFHLCLQK